MVGDVAVDEAEEGGVVLAVAVEEAEVAVALVDDDVGVGVADPDEAGRDDALTDGDAAGAFVELGFEAWGGLVMKLNQLAL